MSKRLYQMNKSGFISAQMYYQTVLDNPKANERLKKKAKDIMDACAGITGWNDLRRAAAGEMTLAEYLKIRRAQKVWGKRNIGFKRRHSGVPVVTAFNNYVEYAKGAVAN